MPTRTAKAKPTAMWMASTSGSNTRDAMTVPMSPVGLLVMLARRAWYRAICADSREGSP
jgi:hypothetical protein